MPTKYKDRMKPKGKSKAKKSSGGKNPKKQRTNSY